MKRSKINWGLFLSPLSAKIFSFWPIGRGSRGSCQNELQKLKSLEDNSSVPSSPKSSIFGQLADVEKVVAKIGFKITWDSPKSSIFGQLVQVEKVVTKVGFKITWGQFFSPLFAKIFNFWQIGWCWRGNCQNGLQKSLGDNSSVLSSPKSSVFGQLVEVEWTVSKRSAFSIQKKILSSSSLSWLWFQLNVDVFLLKK